MGCGSSGDRVLGDGGYIGIGTLGLGLLRLRPSS